MPITFPTSKLTILVELQIGSTWTDVSSYVMWANHIQIRRGRRPGQRTGSTNECTLTFKNADKRFSPRNVSGPYFGYLKNGTPIRVSLDPGTGSERRYTGTVPTWAPQVKGHPNDRFVTVTAVGELDAIERDTAPLQSAPRRYLPGTSPLHYWPMEDGAFADELGRPDSGTTSLYPFTGTHPSGAVISAPQWGAGFLGPWLPSVLSRSGGAGMTVVWAPVVMPLSPTVWTVDLMFAMTNDVGADEADDVGGTIDINPLYLGGASGWPQLLFLPSLGLISVEIDGSSADSASLPGIFDGRGHHLRWTCTQAGADVTWAVWVDGTSVNTGTATTFTLPVVSQLGLTMVANASAAAQGHLAIWNTAGPTLADAVDAAFGHRGELATDRFSRLLLEEGRSGTVVEGDADTQRMGPQGAARLADLLREVEQVSEGVLDETVGGVVRLTCPSVRFGQAVALSVDYGAGEVLRPFTPKDSADQQYNDWTVSRQDGATARHQVTEGPTSISDYPDGIGARPTAATLNLYTDDQVAAHAAYRAYRDSVDAPRYDALGVNLAKVPSLITDWLACDISSRTQITDPPDDAGPDTVDLTIEGITETFDQASWDLSLYLEPSDISQQVGEYDDARYDCPASTLNAALDTTETSVKVAVNCGAADGACRWAHDDGDYVVRAGGETMTVTAVSSPVAAFVAAGAAAHADNASVTPGLPAGMVKGDLMVIFAAIRNSGTGTPVLPSGYELMHANENVAFYGKIHSGSESAPTQQFLGSTGGASCSAQMAAFRSTQLNVVNDSGQLNGSAQDITLPLVTVPRGNCVFLYYGWKQDDWTSVVGPFSEIGEPSTTLGSDQGLWWSYQIQTAATDRGPSTATVTGGAAAISRSGALVIAGDVQTLTVTRSTNGIVKAHDAGKPLGLATPTRWAL